jgi:hypothetical protein
MDFENQLVCLLVNIDTGCSLLPSISRFDTFFSYLPCIICFEVSYLQRTKIKKIEIKISMNVSKLPEHWNAELVD